MPFFRLCAVPALLVLSAAPAFADLHGCKSNCVAIETRSVGVVPFYVVDQGPSYYGRPPITTRPNIVFTGTHLTHQRPVRTIPVQVQPIGEVAHEARPTFIKVRAPRHREAPVAALY
jgi:hypothetical protein